MCPGRCCRCCTTPYSCSRLPNPNLQSGSILENKFRWLDLAAVWHYSQTTLPYTVPCSGLHARSRHALRHKCGTEIIHTTAAQDAGRVGPVRTNALISNLAKRQAQHPKRLSCCLAGRSHTPPSPSALRPQQSSSAAAHGCSDCQSTAEIIK
jgi:hypothetical protein